MKRFFAFLAFFLMFVLLISPVNAAPDCTASGDLSNVCAGTSGLSASVPTGPVGTIYLWSISPNGTISGANDQPTVNYSADTSGLLTLTVQVTDPAMEQCLDDYSFTVYSNPTANITADGSSGSSADVCASIDIFLNGNPSGGSGSWSSHLWTGSGAAYLDSSSSQTPVFNCATPGIYTLTYTVIDTNTCQGSDSITITVHNNPACDILVEGSSVTSTEVCALEPLSLNGNPSGGSGSWSSHLWQGDGAVHLSSTTIQNPVFNADSAGNYSLVYTVLDAYGCPATDTVSILVRPHPVAEILSNGSSVSSDWYCINEVSSLNGNPSGGSGVYTSHVWTGDPGLLSSYSIQTPTFQSSVSGDFSFTYTVTDDEGCSFSDTINIHVDTPVADIEANGTSTATFEVCAGVTVDLNGNPTGGASGRTHQWTGDTGPLNNPNVQQPDFNTSTTGVYNLTYTVIDNQGCTDSDSISITVHPNPTVDITMGGLPIDDEWLCLNESLNLSGNPSGGSGVYSIHRWSGNGAAHLNSTSIESPVFQSSTPGYYTLYYRVTDSRGCIDTDAVHIMVANPIPNIEFDGMVTPTGTACAGEGYILNGNPLDGSHVYVTHTWSGDVSPLHATGIQSPIFNTETTGVYNLTYTVVDDEGCIGSDSIIITVVAPPTADAGSDDLILFGESTTISAAASSCNGGCSYSWTVASGDIDAIDSGEASVDCVVSPDSPTVFQVTVTDSNGCTASDTVVITVGYVPIPTISTLGLAILLGVLGIFISRRSTGNHAMKTSVLVGLFVMGIVAGAGAQTTRFVDPASVSPGAPFESWDTAAHTIQAAIDGSGFGDVIYVANGTYNEVVTVDEEIKLRSWCQSPEDCVINGTNPGTPALTVSEPDMSNHQIEVSGFRFQGGSKGVYITGNRTTQHLPLVRNCIIDNYSGIGVHVVNGAINLDFCTLDNNNVGLFADNVSFTSATTHCIVSNNTTYGLHLDTNYYIMSNNCYYSNGVHVFGGQVAFCDEWSAEALPDGIDPQFVPGTYQLAESSPCRDFTQGSIHTQCNETIFDRNESPFDLGAYGGYGSWPLPPYYEEPSFSPRPGDFRINANEDITFIVRDEGTAGLDLSSMLITLSNHGHVAETFTISDCTSIPLSEFGTPVNNCRRMGYEISLPGATHQPFTDFANVRVQVAIGDQNPMPSFGSINWDFFADDLNPPIVLPGFFPGQGAVNVPVYGPIMLELYDAGVGYDPESIEFTLNSDPLSLNISDVHWYGNTLVIFPRPRFLEGQLNTLTFVVADFYGNILSPQTVTFTCAGDTDLPFVSGVTNPAASPSLPDLAPRPVPDDGSFSADVEDPVTFYFQDFSSNVNLANMQVAIRSGSQTYRYYLEDHGGSNRIFSVSGDPKKRRITCQPPGSWALNSEITVTITGGSDTAATPNNMTTAVYRFTCTSAAIPSTTPIGLLITLATLGLLIWVRKK